MKNDVRVPEKSNFMKKNVIFEVHPNWYQFLNIVFQNFASQTKYFVTFSSTVRDFEYLDYLLTLGHEKRHRSSRHRSSPAPWKWNMDVCPLQNSSKMLRYGRFVVKCATGTRVESQEFPNFVCFLRSQEFPISNNFYAVCFWGRCKRRCPSGEWHVSSSFFSNPFWWAELLVPLCASNYVFCSKVPEKSNFRKKNVIFEVHPNWYQFLNIVFQNFASHTKYFVNV